MVIINFSSCVYSQLVSDKQTIDSSIDEILLNYSMWNIEGFLVFTNENKELLFVDRNSEIDKFIFYKYEIKENRLYKVPEPKMFGEFCFNIDLFDSELFEKINKLFLFNEDLLAYSKIDENSYVINIERFAYETNHEAYFGIYSNNHIIRIPLFLNGKKVNSFLDYSSVFIYYDKYSNNIYFVGEYSGDNSSTNQMIMKYNFTTKKVYLINKVLKGEFKNIMRIPGTSILVFYMSGNGLVFYIDTVPED